VSRLVVIHSLLYHSDNPLTRGHGTFKLCAVYVSALLETTLHNVYSILPFYSGFIE